MTGVTGIIAMFEQKDDCLGWLCLGFSRQSDTEIGAPADVHINDQVRAVLGRRVALAGTPEKRTQIIELALPAFLPCPEV